MALARVKTWNPGDVLTAADLNGEFNNVLNNPITLVSPTTGPINFNLQTHTNLVPTALTASSGVVGQVLQLSSAGTPAWSPPTAHTRVRNMQMIASSQNAQFTADEYLLKTTSTAPQTFSIQSTAAFTVNLNTAGPAANGRDQAGSFASTYLHYYVITTGAYSTTPAGIVSSQPPSVGPTLPTGYSAWAYLASLVYSSASTTIVTNSRARGAWIWMDTVLNTLAVGQSTTPASIATAATIPTIAQNLCFNTLVNNQAGGATASVTIQTLSGTNTFVITAVSGFPYTLQFNYPNTALTYVWSTNPAAGGLSLALAGYSVPNGDGV